MPYEKQEQHIEDQEDEPESILVSTLLLEHQLSLQPLVLVLPPPPVLPSLSLVLRHCSKESSFVTRKSQKITLFGVFLLCGRLVVSAGGHGGLGVTGDDFHSVNLGELAVLAELNLQIRKANSSHLHDM